MQYRLHDPAVRDAIRARVQKLTPGAQRAWGKMTVDQMLWHCNTALDEALGRGSLAVMKSKMPAPILKFFLFNVPWPKGAPTHPELVADQNRYPFEAERDRCVALIDEFTARRLDAADWPKSAFLGPMSGVDWTRLHAKHLDHHLRQFNA